MHMCGLSSLSTQKYNLFTEERRIDCLILGLSGRFNHHESD